MTKANPHPEIRVKPHGYQPSKAELAEEVRIEATPEQLIAAAFRPVKVVEDPQA